MTTRDLYQNRNWNSRRCTGSSILDFMSRGKRTKTMRLGLNFIFPSMLQLTLCSKHPILRTTHSFSSKRQLKVPSLNLQFISSPYDLSTSRCTPSTCSCSADRSSTSCQTNTSALYSSTSEHGCVSVSQNILVFDYFRLERVWKDGVI